MPKAKKRKLPIAFVETASNTSSTPHSSRTTIRRFHVLLKRRAQLQASRTITESAKALADVEDEIKELGGLEQYQRMSAVGQGTDRGGGSEKVFIGWLKNLGVHKDRSSKLRLLEVGALKPDNYSMCIAWINSTPIDLRSRHPSIMEQDFLQLDVNEHREKWDAISLSLVVNFVPEPRDRGRMLSLSHDILVPNGLLFLALPFPCVNNSRYVDFSYLKALMEAIGFAEVKERWKESRKMAYWLYRKTNSSGESFERFQTKRTLRQGNLVSTTMISLPVIHWNDVYRVSPQKVSPHSQDTIDTAQFAAVLDDIRDSWVALPTGKKDGLVLFSGDVFSPSVESSVTRGSHMVPVMNLLAPDVSLTGNHDFDFGYPHLSKLVQDTTFPWILSNIIDSDTSQVPECLHGFQIFERVGIKIGVIGLVEKEWISTVATWPSNFTYKDMTETGMDLSQRLRGEHHCDFIIALTHSRVPNDILLAKNLGASSTSAQDARPIESLHGVDILLGGHDHLYFVSKGVNSWEGYDLEETVLGAEEDHGDVLVIKSGTDFRDLSEMRLDLERTPPGSIRSVVIKRVTGKRHPIRPGSRVSQSMQTLLKTLLSSVSDTMNAPVCKTATTIDCRSQYIRTAESAAGNLFSDIIRHAYDETLCLKGCGGSDGVFICAGTLRGDSTYGPGVVTLGNILEILPFEDPIVVLELDGGVIWDGLESALSTWPAQEGRFPIISGFRVSWDSCREPGNRVLGVWILHEEEEGIVDTTSNHVSLPLLVDGEPITRDSARTYKIVTREYMAQGHDGFVAFKGRPYLVDDESGHLMSSIVRKYLLGSQYINKMTNTLPNATVKLRSGTEEAISRETERKTRQFHIEQWKRVAGKALQWSRRSRSHYQDQLTVCTTEHMTPVDAYDGQSVRRGKDQTTKHHAYNEEDLIVLHPEIDGRLKNAARD